MLSLKLFQNNECVSTYTYNIYIYIYIVYTFFITGHTIIVSKLYWVLSTSRSGVYKDF